LTQQIKETKNYNYQNKTKHNWRTTKARCQLGDKATKLKLTSMLRGKEIKKRKKE